MSRRKRMIQDEAIPQVKAQKLEHAKHSDHYSKKRNARFSVQGLGSGQAPTPPQKKPSA